MATQPADSSAGTGPSTNGKSQSLNATFASGIRPTAKSRATTRIPQSSLQTPLKKFTYFTKLSPELRLMVWNYSLEPRFVEMRFLNNYTSTQFDILASTPAVLHINREVRAEYRKRYKVMFLHKKCRAPAYVNTKIDTLHIKGYFDFRQLCRTINILPNKSDIRHLSITPKLLSLAAQMARSCHPSSVVVSTPRNSYRIIH
ncbi:hypothetical protein BKA65DRAFT_550859 [Rhexocercosporidium sp. MPI-PUGE-AT-0058]|nr:hypothetical protein BKA65DRAFT_550859 [Rhexocercosporidium sp. MPI-PUGE-AT-0058]